MPQDRQGGDGYRVLLRRLNRGSDISPTTFLLISVLSQVVGIVGCVRLFQSKGKDPLGGVLTGFVFGVIGLAVAWAALRHDDLVTTARTYTHVVVDERELDYAALIA